MTLNALGTKMKDSDKTLAEELGIELPEEPKAKELEIESVYTENLAEIVVELSNTELVKNKEALTNPNNYRLNDSKIKVYNVDVDGDDVILTLVPYGKVDDQKDVNVLVKGKKYDLTIRNIDPAINKTEKFEAKDTAVPTVTDVDFIGTHGIKVTTSEPVRNPQERNFKVGDKRTSMIIEQYGRELILTPYHNRSFDKDAEILVIEELNDFAGYRAATTIENLELSTDEATPEVVKAYRSGNKLTLIFDRDVYRKSISAYENRRSNGNVSFVERRVTFFAEEAKKVDTNVVEYTFEREIPRDAVITVEGVQNHFEKAMEKQDVETTLYVDDYAPVVISKLSNNIVATKVVKENDLEIAKSTKGLKITFDKDIKELADAVKHIEDKELTEEDAIKEELKDYFKSDLDKFFEIYRLEVSRKGRDDANSVKLHVEEVKSDSITISFEDIVVNNKYRDYDYVLEVQDFTDLNRNRMVREYIDFQIVPEGTAFDVDGAIEVKEEDSRGNVEIVINFTKAVDKDSAENVKNYFFGKDGKDLIVDTAYVERDGKRVTLVIRDTTKSKVLEKEVLEISPAVTDLDDNSIAGSRFFNLDTGKRIEDEIATKIVNAAKALFEGKTFENIGAIEEVEVESGVEIKVEVIEEPTKTVDGKAKITLTMGNITEEVEVILEKLPVLEAPTEGNKELTVENLTPENVRFLVYGLGEPQEVVTLSVAKSFIESKYRVNFNADSIKVEDGKISIDGEILSTEDWGKVKENGDIESPYRITVLLPLEDNIKNKVAKIAMYEDGLAVIEEL